MLGFILISPIFWLMSFLCPWRPSMIPHYTELFCLLSLLWSLRASQSFLVPDGFDRFEQELSGVLETVSQFGSVWFSFSLLDRGCEFGETMPQRSSVLLITSYRAHAIKWFITAEINLNRHWSRWYVLGISTVKSLPPAFYLIFFFY